MKKYKMSFKGLFEPTPSLFRRIGLALVGAATLGATFSFVTDEKMVGFTILIVGMIGKFITEFFSESLVEVKDEEKGETPQDTPDDNPIT